MNQEEQIKILESSGFINYNGYHITEIEVGKKAVMEAEIKKESLNPYDFAHGGFIFGLGDTAMGILARTTGRKAVTLNANISYLRPIKGKYFIAKAILIKSGKNTACLRADIYNDENKISAIMDSNYYYFD